MPEIRKRSNAFERFAQASTLFTGSTAAFSIAILIIVVWLITGPLFHYSDTWQLVINTGTTIITFLMVFLIQRTQNKDSMALQLKLNELIAATKGASNRLIDIEDLTEQELIILHKYFARLAEKAQQEQDIAVQHTIEEADELHDMKYKTPEEIIRKRKPKN